MTSEGTVLVVGAGGIGGPAALALAAARVSSIRIVDPDVVDETNLARQLLFREEDLGRPKALVARARLAAPGVTVDGRVEAFDEATAAALLEGVAVAIDATDGAATKDRVLALCRERGVPIVHAAALGGEGRLLSVAGAGRPCIACLFGYASEGEGPTGDTCARVGVWPAVPGAVGALAAAAALRRLEDPGVADDVLLVLDFATPRAARLRVPTDPACPACGRAPRRPRRVGAAGAAPVPRAVAPAGVLDLREEACPMNLLRTRRALDALAPETTLSVWLGEEGESTVPGGIVALGHRIVAEERAPDALRLVVARGAGPGADPAGRADPAWLRRYARQIVLADLGEAGQRRIGAARLVVEGRGAAADVAADHLRAAGVGAVERRERADDGVYVRGEGLRIGGSCGAEGAGARFDGAALADAVLRALVAGEPTRARLRCSGEAVEVG